MKTINYIRYPFNLKYNQDILKTKPVYKDITPYAKEYNIKLVEMEQPGIGTYVVYKLVNGINHEFLKNMVQVYADQFHRCKVVSISEFLYIMEEVSFGNLPDSIEQRNLDH